MKILFVIRESSKSHKGGDVIQILQTAHFLEKLKCEVYITDNIDEISNYKVDIIHLTGINLQLNLQKTIQKIKSLKYNPITVLSTIYVSYEDYEKNVRKNIFLKIILNIFGYKKLELLKEILRNKKFSIYNICNFLFMNKDYLYLKYLKDIDLFLPNSVLEKEAIIRDFNISEEKIEIINNGVDFQNFSKPEIIPFDNFVLSVGRIEELKNQINLVKACKKIGKNLILIGNLPKSQAKYYQELFKELDNKRIYIGEIDHKDLSTYYSKCTIHALVSYFETCGLTTLEAISFNKNVVVSDVGYVKSYYKDKVNYCNPYDIDSIAHALLNAENKQINLEFCNMIRENYSWQKSAEQTLKAYSKVLM